MLDPRFEYSALLLLLTLFVAVFWPPAGLHYILQPWLIAAAFTFHLTCVLIERHALSHLWWVFHDNSILGVWILGIPLEEHCIFLLIYLLTTFFWETFSS